MKGVDLILVIVFIILWAIFGIKIALIVSGIVSVILLGIAKLGN